MTILATFQPTIEQKEIIYRLWNEEYPEKLRFRTMADLDNYLKALDQTNYYFLKNDLDKIEGWAITFMRENEEWFAIIVDSRQQGRGRGTLLLNRLKENTDILNGWVIDHNNDIKPNGELYRSPLLFYQKNDFLICPEIRLELPVLSAVKIIWRRR